jgi:hypothetical protein
MYIYICIYITLIYRFNEVISSPVLALALISEAPSPGEPSNAATEEKSRKCSRPSPKAAWKLPRKTGWFLE